jgi:hypothetical protein
MDFPHFLTDILRPLSPSGFACLTVIFSDPPRSPFWIGIDYRGNLGHQGAECPDRVLCLLWTVLGIGFLLATIPLATAINADR